MGSWPAAAARAGVQRRGDRAPDGTRTPAPASRGVSTPSAGRSSTRAGAGWRRCFRAGRRAVSEPLERGGSLGDRRLRNTQIEVSVRTCSPGSGGVRLHRRAGLRPDDLTMHDGIPVTRPIRTLVDLAARAGARRHRADGQRGGSTRPGRSRDPARTRSGPTAASGASRGCGRCSTAAPSASRGPSLERRFLRARRAGGAARAADAAVAQRLRGRLLLARPRARRRDRRPALSPHAGRAGAGPACATRPTPPPGSPSSASPTRRSTSSPATCVETLRAVGRPPRGGRRGLSAAAARGA